MTVAEERSIAERATRQLTVVDAQEALFDQVIDDADFADALEDRERKKAAVSSAKGEYEDAAEVVKSKLAALNLGDDTVVRCGRFRIKISPPGESSHVEYDTTPRRNTTITLLDRGR